MIRVLRQMRDALDSRRAGPDNGDALVGELVQISVGIAAGVSVVPSTGVEGVPFEAVDAATFLDDADILHPGLAQTRAGKEASEAAADDQNVNRVGQRRASETRRDVGIIDVVAVVALHFDVLFIAVGADAFVALLAILGAQQFGVEVEFLSTIAGGWRFVSVAHCGNSQLVLMSGKRTETFGALPKWGKVSSKTEMTKLLFPAHSIGLPDALENLIELVASCENRNGLLPLTTAELKSSQ